MTLSDDEQDIEQEFYASSESETTGRDAASSKSTFQVEINDAPTAAMKIEEYDDETYTDDLSYDTPDPGYIGRKTENQKATSLKDIRLYGAKDFSKKIKEELGKNKCLHIIDISLPVVLLEVFLYKLTIPLGKLYHLSSHI